MSHHIATENPGITTMDILTIQDRYVLTDGINHESKIVYVKIPKKYSACNHGGFDYETRIGRGAFGHIVPMTRPSLTCAKRFNNSSDFYHELIMNDLIEMTMSFNYDLCNKVRPLLIGILGACVKCKAIFYKRYNCSLHHYRYWNTHNIRPLAENFRLLVDAIYFLNKTCNVFHSDISPCNILVETAYDSSHILKLIITDLGISSICSGGDYEHITLRAPRGRNIYCICSKRFPLGLCKDDYKPAFLLRHCHKIFKEKTLDPNTLSIAEPISQDLALRTDIVALGYTLLYVIERYIDSKRKYLTGHYYRNLQETRQQPLYYLKCAVPKVVLCNFLSCNFSKNINLGVSTSAKPTDLGLPVDEGREFLQQCGLFLEEVNAAYAKVKYCTHLDTLVDLLEDLVSTDTLGPSGEYTWTALTSQKSGI